MSDDPNSVIPSVSTRVCASIVGVEDSDKSL